MFGKLFSPNKSQIDVATILMLVGENTIWKAIWGRMRAQRLHWTHFVFTISPGWVILASSIFAAMRTDGTASNIIFDRIPEGYSERGLLMTNLDSGATHSADNLILQNIWQVWSRGIDKRRPKNLHPEIELTKEVGVLDVRLDRLTLRKTMAINMQLGCLVVQILGSVVAATVEGSAELLVVILIVWVSQMLLIFALVPKYGSWYRTTRKKPPCPVLLHKGLNSSRVLIVSKTYLDNSQISLEEFCWRDGFKGTWIDTSKLSCAGFAFLSSAYSIVLIGSMSGRSKLWYLIIGSLGLLAHVIDAALEPDWSRQLASAGNGAWRCASSKSSLMSAIGILEAADFCGAGKAARELYPDNTRLRDSIDRLRVAIGRLMCSSCRSAVKEGVSSKSTFRCQKTGVGQTRQNCSAFLTEAASQSIMGDKQQADALAAIAFVLSEFHGTPSRSIDTTAGIIVGRRHSYW